MKIVLLLVAVLVIAACLLLPTFWQRVAKVQEVPVVLPAQAVPAIAATVIVIGADSRYSMEGEAVDPLEISRRLALKSIGPGVVVSVSEGADEERVIALLDLLRRHGIERISIETRYEAPNK